MTNPGGPVRSPFVALSLRQANRILVNVTMMSSCAVAPTQPHHLWIACKIIPNICHITEEALMQLGYSFPLSLHPPSSYRRLDIIKQPRNT
jgi:hypothetical protein